MGAEYQPIKTYEDEKRRRTNSGNAEKMEDPYDNKEFRHLALQISEPTMAIKGEPTSTSAHLPLSHRQPQPPPQQRVLSLDVFRGLTIVVKSLFYPSLNYTAIFLNIRGRFILKIFFSKKYVLFYLLNLVVKK